MEELRLVLLGKRGSGKSSSGNTLLGTKTFHTSPSSRGVTEACCMGYCIVEELKVWVVDTPGWNDTESIEVIVRCIDFTNPGPHVFLFMLPIGRFTKEETDAATHLLEAFGDEAMKYTMVLFTKGDDLDENAIDNYVENAHTDLKKLIEACGERYHVFNNRDKKNREQVFDLLRKIKAMVAANEGQYYPKTIHQIMENYKKLKDESFTIELNHQAINEDSEAGSDHGTVAGRGSSQECNTVVAKSVQDSHLSHENRSEDKDMDHRTKVQSDEQELKWQLKLAEVQSSTEKEKMMWLQEKGKQEKEIHLWKEKAQHYESMVEQMKMEQEMQQKKNKCQQEIDQLTREICNK